MLVYNICVGGFALNAYVGYYCVDCRYECKHKDVLI